MSDMLTTSEVAEYLRISRRTLELWRQQGTGPAFVRAGARVVYRRIDLLEWIESRTVKPSVGCACEGME